MESGASERPVVGCIVVWLDGSAKWSIATEQITETQNSKDDLNDEMNVWADPKRCDKSVFGCDQLLTENNANNKCCDDRNDRHPNEDLYDDHSSVTHGVLTI
jgi:hypothetical protein